MKSYNRQRRIRFVVLFYLTLILFLALVFRLVHLQHREADYYSQLARFQHQGWAEINALRGAIYDRNGTNLAFSLSMPSVAVNPRKIRDAERTAFYLGLALGKEKDEILPLLSPPHTFSWIARKIDSTVASRIKRLNLPGVFVIDEPSGRRFYPKGRVASHIIGLAGIDDQGLDGVEANYDELLQGESGRLNAEMDRSGRILPGGHVDYQKPVPGKNIYLTIDESIQYIVERELEATIKKHNAAGGTVIVYDPRTGDILALASYPNFDPSDPSTITMNRLRNRAITDSYEPGSTFKVILAAAALDSGRASMKDEFYSGNSIQVGGYSLRNADDGLYSPTGYETIDGVISYSFNTGAVSIGMRLGSKAYFDYIEKLGFGRQTGIDLPGEVEGILAHVDYWRPINLATISYGQGISVTPIQMVQAFGAIANDGVLMRPRVVKKITHSDGRLYREIEPQSLGQVLKPDSCHEILKVLANTCENGTGKGALIPGYTVGGKTGTANLVENGVYSSNRYIASFIGVVPVEDPRLVMLIKIDEPKGTIWGGTVAAPLFHDVGSQIMWRLGVKPRNMPEAAEGIRATPQGVEENN